VVPGSPADLAGFERGDVIVQMGDARAWAPAQVSWHMAASRGETLSLVVSRAGVQASYPIEIPERQRRRDSVAAAPPPTEAPDAEVADLQARIAELERLLAGSPPSAATPAR
jgi:C-terminal processing protease CtpA/Prc